MELTEKAVARPDELVVSSDFESRIEWYKEWRKTSQEKSESKVDWEPKRRGFVQIWYIRGDVYGGLRMDAELAPPDEIIKHCTMIKSFWLERTGYFKWAPDLKKQFASAGVDVTIPSSLTDERDWRINNPPKLLSEEED